MIIMLLRIFLVFKIMSFSILSLPTLQTIALGLLVAAVWFTTKQKDTSSSAQVAVAPGMWVLTIGGAYGKVLKVFPAAVLLQTDAIGGSVLVDTHAIHCITEGMDELIGGGVQVGAKKNRGETDLKLVEPTVGDTVSRETKPLAARKKTITSGKSNKEKTKKEVTE